jgi:hypothetical protein
MLTILLIAALALLINIPLGYLRSKCRRFSFKWMLYVHLSVPLILAARLFTHTDAVFILFFVSAALAGQFIGGRLEIKT